MSSANIVGQRIRTIREKRQMSVEDLASALPGEVGYLFYKCRVSSDCDKKHFYYLGRPWRENAATSFIECEISQAIHPALFAEWNSLDVPRYYIYPRLEYPEIFGNYADKDFVYNLMEKFNSRYESI